MQSTGSIANAFTVDQLEVRVSETRQQMGSEAAKAVAAKIRQLLETREFINIIFAAAPSQNEFLACLSAADDIAWERINAFHMDEYIGLPDKAPQRFGNFLKEAIFDCVPFRSVFFLNGNATDIAQECKNYARLLEEYPTDIVCMGIGENCHIAFNDPPVADFNDAVLVKEVELDQPCRVQQVNDGCFDSIDKVPTHALTLTIPALMKAPAIYCIVPGPKKADAIYYTLTAEISETYPSTILRTHPKALLFIDQASSGRFFKEASL